jgi:8-oxo-dGTP pyrophosphatase MutT (NUDIX family)
VGAVREGAYRRRSARVLLVDGQDRVLLLEFLDDHLRPAAGVSWMTPGGGVRDGEPLAEAAARELAEEVGLLVEPGALGAPVAVTSGYADLGWAAGVFRDDFFFLRVGAHDVDDSGLEDLERSHLVGHRWWTLAELASTEAVIYPNGLASLLAGLVGGDLPAQPVPLPWHH